MAPPQTFFEAVAETDDAAELTELEDDSTCSDNELTTEEEAEETTLLADDADEPATALALEAASDA